MKRLAIAPLLLVVAVAASAQDVQRYQTALDAADANIQQMLAQLGPGEQETRAFALTVAQKAIALSGLGRDEDAHWYWEIARGLSPEVDRIDLSKFGEAGERLRPLLVDVTQTPRRVGGDVRAPVVMKRVEPLYAEGARKARVSGIVILEAMIDKTGIVRSAKILKSLPAATLAYTAAEALRQWRFIPARLNGEPIDVLFNLTINFRLTADKEEQK